MFGKVKKILGIEGVKLELIIPEKVNKETGIVTGVMKFTSLSDDNKIESIQNLPKNYEECIQNFL